MSTTVEVRAEDLRVLRAALDPRIIARSARKAGTTALRDGRSTASKRARQRKRIKARMVRLALLLRKPGPGASLDGLEWSIDVRGDTVPLSSYPHRQNRKGVSVTVNRGKRTLVQGAFVASMATGHQGVFARRGGRRLPIKELLGSRPVDALLHAGEADIVLRRARESFTKTYQRVLPLEIDKSRRGGTR